MKTKTIEVVYEDGVFKPQEKVDLKEGGKMDICIEDEKVVIHEFRVNQIFQHSE